MTFTSSGYKLGPSFTPPLIIKLIILTCATSLTASLLNPFFLYVFKVPGPENWLSLSWWGINHYLWYQPLSYLFVHYTPASGMTFWELLTLFFQMYILWVFGSDILLRTGDKGFLKFYLFTGIAAGLVALAIMKFSGHYTVISGPASSIFALLIVWTLLNPESVMLVFFLIPVKAKWLTLGIIGAVLLINLSNLNFLFFFFYLTAIIIAYLYALCAFELNSPFPQLYRLELFVMRTYHRLKKLVRLPQIGKYRSSAGEPKIFDIDTQKPVSSDDQFIDEMLEKISKSGEHSLSWQEKQRMQRISEKRAKKK